MKANRDISRRLSFDAFADLYDAARPRITAALTRQLFQFAGVVEGASVLDVGAGTGQWLDALLELGCEVHALEPGEQMRNHIRRTYGSQVSVHGGEFEAFQSAHNFDAVLSSNAFHWLDPMVAYHRAHDVLGSGGTILLVWNFVTTGADDRVNRIIARCLPKEQKELATLLGVPEKVDEWLDEGRNEMRAGGVFDEPRWKWFEEPIQHDVTSLVDLLASYANDTPMSDELRAVSASQLESDLGADDLTRMRNRVYAVTARAT